MRKRLFSLSKIEKGILAALFAVFVFSGLGLIYSFYIEHTSLEPTVGGEFVEGMVRTSDAPYNFNPLFAEGVESDVSHLVFAGLMRYNPENGEIEDSLATHTLSPDKTVYEFTLKDNVFWHDGQPITSNDIIFTFHDVIQHEDFQGTLIKRAFENVLIERIDEHSVRFTIPEKRKTFFTNFTIGLLPRHQLAGVPIVDLIHDGFNQDPIGSGPYRFEGFYREQDFTAIRFTSFPEYFDGQANIETIIFRIYPSLDQLLTHVSEIDAIRPMQTREIEVVPESSRFKKVTTISPRYLAVFFNLREEETLVTKKIRQAMRAVIDTTALAKEYKGERVDTPLVELWPQDDIVNVSRERAVELLEEAGFTYRTVNKDNKEDENTADTDEGADKIVDTNSVHESAPDVMPEQETSTPPHKNSFIYEPTTESEYITGETQFYIVGSFPEGTTSVRVNDWVLQQFNIESGRFSYNASVSIGTLAPGGNTFTVEFLNSEGGIIATEKLQVLLETDPNKLQKLLNLMQPGEDSVPVSEEKEGIPPPVEEEGAEREEENEVTEVPPDSSEEEESVPSDTPEPEVVIAEEEVSPRYRVNENGEHILLHFVYLDAFRYLDSIAKEMQKSWEDIGIEVVLEPLDAQQLRKRISERDYDLLLLPQDLGYNLDPYPYFHLSQVGKNGFNVSDWKNLKASLLLEEIRATHDNEKRFDSLSQLRDIIIDDVPAIFLFTPTYTWLYDQKVKNVHINHLALLSDRYSRVNDFYIREARKFQEERKVSDFFPWLITQTKSIFSLSSTQ